MCCIVYCVTVTTASSSTHCPSGYVFLSKDTIALSHIDCSGNSPEQMRCVFQNVFVKFGVIWLVSDTPSEVQIPRLLCSAVTKTHQHAKYCQFRVITRSEILLELHEDQKIQKRGCVQGIQVALAFGRLARANCYHSLFEDLIPIYETLTKYPQFFSSWLDMASRVASTPPDTADGGQYRDMMLFVEDESPDYNTNYYTFQFWKRFFPDVLVVDKYTTTPSALYFMHHLVAGSNSSCVHYFHCSRHAYTTPGIALAFRHFILSQVGISAANTPPPPSAVTTTGGATAVVSRHKFRERNPKLVTIIQRQFQESRQLLNINTILSICNSVFRTGRGDESPCVVKYYGDMSLDDQIRQTHSSDILICVHGGALGNVLFAKHQSMVIDIYPFSFPYSFHGLMNWIRYSLLDVAEGSIGDRQLRDSLVNIGHAPFEVQHAEAMYFLRQYKKNQSRLVALTPCLCNTSSRVVWFKCGFGKMFYRAAGLHIDPQQFTTHLTSALTLWQRRQITDTESQSETQVSPSSSSAAYVSPLSLASSLSRSSQVSQRSEGMMDVPPVPKTIFKMYSLAHTEPWYYPQLREEARQAAFLQNKALYPMGRNHTHSTKKTPEIATTPPGAVGSHNNNNDNNNNNHHPSAAGDTSSNQNRPAGSLLTRSGVPLPPVVTPANTNDKYIGSALLPDCSDHRFFKPRPRRRGGKGKKKQN